MDGNTKESALSKASNEPPSLMPLGFLPFLWDLLLWFLRFFLWDLRGEEGESEWEESVVDREEDEDEDEFEVFDIAEDEDVDSEEIDKARGRLLVRVWKLRVCGCKAWAGGVVASGLELRLKDGLGEGG